MNEIDELPPGPLADNLRQILDMVPERDAKIENVPYKPFNSPGPLHSVELVLMQLAKHNYHMNVVYRQNARFLLQDDKVVLSKAARIFISDLLVLPPIKKPNNQVTLVKDVLIIWALMILKEFGYLPTKNAESKNPAHYQKVSGSQLVWEYLNARGLAFADVPRTIEQIWRRRESRFRRIELAHLIS